MIDVPVEVKDALREGRLKKNYRMVVLNDDSTEDFTIDNDTLVSESVSIDERMCSGDTIKFGLCEGSSLEFQYFDHPNITDRQVKVFCDVEYGANTPYTIPMGFFTVKKCSRQASTGIIKATAYNKLQSDYLDAKANELLLDVFGSSDLPVSVYDIEKVLLSSYAVDKSGRLPLSWEPENRYYPMEGTLNIGFASNDMENDNPFNYYSWFRSGGLLSGTGKITLKSTVYVLDDTDFAFNSLHYIGLEFLKGIFETFERNIYSQFTTILTNAHFKNSVTGETIFQDFASRWYAFCGFAITRRSASGDILESYSTIQYEYNQAHGITNSCKGTASDFINRIYEFYKSSAGGMVSYGKAYRIAIYLPLTWQLYNSSGQGNIKYYFDGFNSTNTEPLTYIYYDGDTQTEISKEYPHIYYGNGDVFKKINGDSGSYTGALIDLNTIVPISEIIGITEAEKTTLQISELPEFTLREIISADYETVCQFGQLSRITDLFSGVELNHSRLLPADTLYPATDLYPDGAQESAFRSQYSKLWADEGNVRKWRYLIITYKGLDGDGNETEYTLQRTVNNDGTDNYNCSDNWLFRNLVWTAEQIGTYADAMVAKMRDITWFPFEMWCAGLPYLETGDEIEIPLGNQTYTSYILQRQLKGIQNLQDTYINGTLDIF